MLFRLIITVAVFVVLLADVVMRFRRGFVIDSLRDWGFVPPFCLAVIGGLVVYCSSWIGWLLVVIGAIISSDILEFRVIDPPGSGDRAVSKASLVARSKSVQGGLLAICEIICLSAIVSNLVGIIDQMLQGIFH